MLDPAHPFRAPSRRGKRRVTCSSSRRKAASNGTITLACSGAPTGAKCIAMPASFQLASTSATATISVATTAVTLSARCPSAACLFPLPFQLASARYAPLTVLILALFGIIAGRVRRPTWLVLAGTNDARLDGVRVCGGGGSVSTGPPPPAATPAGTYTITVTATSGTLIQTMRLMLTVQ